MKQLIIICAFFLSVSTAVMAQETYQVRQRSTESKGLVYDKENIYFLRPHTNGFAFGYTIGKIRSYYKTKYMSFEGGWVKHPKEVRQRSEFSGLSPSAQAASSFVFGKQNALLTLRMSWGNKIYVSDKAAYKGVAVGYSYEGGPLLGLLKPYYLDYQSNDTPVRPIKYTKETRDIFLDNSSSNIVGHSNFFQGFNEIKPLLGLQGKASIHLDFAASDEYVRAFEFGAMLDIYPKKVPIMVDVENRPFFINVFANFMFGKRK